jgi:hypothetical protein
MKTLAALVALLVVGACGDPQPKEPKPSASASATPTVTAPTMPAQAKENSPEGAAAFVKHYIDVFNYASNTGDVSELSRLSSPKCDGCQSYIKLYRDTYKAGGYFKDSDWKLSDFDLDFNGEKAIVFVTAKSEPGVYAESSSSSPSAGNAENSDLTFIAERLSNGWRLDTFELQAKS